jgi:shikimate dehydrogenase
VRTEHPSELWLIGDDIARSLSPTMHNAALRALDSPLRYGLRATARAALDDALKDACASCVGVNVTIPHKIETYERLRSISDDDAREAGAVNTIVFARGAPISAHNTDVYGLLSAWRRAALDIVGRSVTIVGAGGAARAVVVAAKRARAARVHIVARRQEAARALADHARTVGIDAFSVPASDSSLIVVTTPRVDDPDALLDETDDDDRLATVHDLRVRPSPELRNAVLSRHQFYVDGASMLLAQGERSLELFLARPLPDVARRAMADALAAALRAS